VAKVTNIRPTVEDEITDLLLKSDSFVIIGKGSGDLKMATNTDHKEVYMMLEALKVELLGSYMDELLDEPEYH
jgi:uncharacterized protein with ATP-grasp and redox domains